MSNKKLEALRALFKKEKDRKENKGFSKRGDVFPFWEMAENEKAVVRILPDKNQDNPYMFYVDKLEHTLSVSGKNEKVPCLQMYGEKCPICDLSRDYYKTEGKESVNGKYYYRKKTSMLRVLVVKDPLPPDEETGETAEGKVLNTQFAFQLMEKIKEEIGSDELGDALPWDMDEGYDFIIKKTPQGKHGTYAIGSGFARRSSAIPEDLRENIELVDLETLLPKNPGFEFVKNKLNAHLNGTSDDSDDNEDDDDDDALAKLAAARKQEKLNKEEPKASVSRASVSDDDDGDDDDDDEDDIMAEIRRKRQARNKQ